MADKAAHFFGERGGAAWGGAVRPIRRRARTPCAVCGRWRRNCRRCGRAQRGRYAAIRTFRCWRRSQGRAYRWRRCSRRGCRAPPDEASALRLPGTERPRVRDHAGVLLLAALRIRFDAVPALRRLVGIGVGVGVGEASRWGSARGSRRRIECRTALRPSRRPGRRRRRSGRGLPGTAPLRPSGRGRRRPCGQPPVCRTSGVLPPWSAILTCASKSFQSRTCMSALIFGLACRSVRPCQASRRWSCGMPGRCSPRRRASESQCAPRTRPAPPPPQAVRPRAPAARAAESTSILIFTAVYRLAFREALKDARLPSNSRIFEPLLRSAVFNTTPPPFQGTGGGSREGGRRKLFLSARNSRQRARHSRCSPSFRTHPNVP